MIYYLHNLRTIYQDANSVTVFCSDTKSNKQQIDFIIPIKIAEDIFKKYKVYNSFGRIENCVHTVYDIKLNSTIINIYKNKDNIVYGTTN